MYFFMDIFNISCVTPIYTLYYISDLFCFFLYHSCLIKYKIMSWLLFFLFLFYNKINTLLQIICHKILTTLKKNYLNCVTIILIFIKNSLIYSVSVYGGKKILNIIEKYLFGIM